MGQMARGEGGVVMGRPALPASQARSQFFKIRVNEREAREIKRMARQAQMTLGAYLRTMGLKGLPQDKAAS